MKILITGHKGFIGKNLQKRIGQIIGMDLKEGDDILKCKKFPRVDLVYHLAAFISVEKSYKKPEMYLRNNIVATAKIVHAYPNTRIIYTNSVASTDSPYGLSKSISADLIRMSKDYVICNLPNIYGGGKDGKGVIDIFREADELKIYGSGKQTRTFVHVDDIVEALIKAKQWEKGEYYLGSGVETSILEIAKSFNKPIKFYPAKKGDIDKSLIDNTTPNWQPRKWR